jgi:hypothetical protein
VTLPNPYTFIRIVTVSLGTLWTVMAVVRVMRFSLRWRSQLDLLRIDDGWWRRRIRVLCLRATVLDPVNLGLMLVLVGLWTLLGLGN